MNNPYYLLAFNMKKTINDKTIKQHLGYAMKKKQLRSSLLFVLLTIFCLSGVIFSTAQAEEKYYDLFLQTTGSWKMDVKDYTVSTEAWSPEQQARPGKFFHGAKLTSDLESRDPGPVLFHVDYPVDGELIFYVETVSDTGIIRIMLDNKELDTITLLTGPEGAGPWIASRNRGNNHYQCDYYKEFQVSIPAGKHDISVQNMGTDWLSINYFIFTNYADQILDQQYNDWKQYKATLGKLNERLAGYQQKAEKFARLKPGETNYDLIPTMKLQLENFEQLVNYHTALDYNLMRTENELAEIFDYLQAGKDYFKTKRGRIKMGYLSDIDDTYQPFDILVPQHYDPMKKYALFLNLHGYQTELRKYSKFLEDDQSNTPDSLGIIQVAVYGRRNHQYRGAAEKDLFDVMDIVQSGYSIDPDKVYLMGSSMGGYGTWLNALIHPDKFAAISPVCAPAIVSGTRYLTTVSPIEYIENAQYLPARIYHGDSDPSVNVNNSRSMVEKLKTLNYNYVYKELPGVGHNAWDYAGADQERLPWLLQYTRNLYPSSIKYKTFYLKDGKAYWLTITGKKNWNDFAEITGEITGRNEITIHADNVASFTLDLKHPDLDTDKPVTVKIDNSTQILKNGSGEAGFYCLDKFWLQGTLPVSGLVKKPGLEGPFLDIETGKFLIVYGTGNPAQVDFLKKIGTLLHNNYAVSDMDITVLPDTTVMNQNLAKTHNLFLLGSPEENLYLREIISGLPLSFSDKEFQLDGSYDRQYTGVQMIYPNPRVADKYIFVSIFPQSLTDIDQLDSFPVADYVIYSFKDGNAELLKDKFFDSNWQVMK